MEHSDKVSNQPQRGPPDRPSSYLYRRHGLALRAIHWINVAAVLVLLASGLQIFNAHPALYWGKSSYTGEPPWIQIGARRAGDGRLEGVTRVGNRAWDTTGVLGVSESADGTPELRGFPAWSTLPSNRWLALGRRWHFFFAWVLVVNGIAYLAYSVATRHLRNDLIPTRRDWRSVARTLKDHLLLRHDRGEAARRYNLLQKLAYLGVAFVLLPFMVVTGLAMSPWFDTAWPGWVDLLGGRQSARTLHFLAATLLVLFAAVHLFQVIVTGPWNNIRSMITGNYRIRAQEGGARVEASDETV